MIEAHRTADIGRLELRGMLVEIDVTAVVPR